MRILCNICWGEWSENNELQNIGCKSSFITFYRSPGMRNQVETQKEGSQRTSIHENSMQYLLRGVVWEQWVAKNLLQIQLYHVLKFPWDWQSSRNTKEMVPRDLNSWEFYAIFAERGGLGTMSCKRFAPNPILSRSIGPLGCAIK